MAAALETFDYLEPAQSPDEIGRLGPYRVLSAIGRGGMGQVFRAEDTRLERIVALKVMNKKFATTNNSRKRFIDEARSMAAVKHDNVVTVYEVGEHSGTPFMAMELLKGHTLEKITTDKQRLPYDQIFGYATQIARGLTAAHDRGIVHRDIKPANIWVEEPSGRIKILDFGLALASGPTDSLAGRGAVVGTPGYLSPEQAQSEPLDDRSDLYSVGVVLYELCCGRLPFVAKTVPEQLIKIIAHRPQRPDEIAKDLPRPYADLITNLLAKEPRDRIRSAKALEASLTSTAEMVRDDSRAVMQIVTAAATVTSAMPADSDPLVATPSSHQKAWVVVTGISVVALLALGGWFAIGHQRTANTPIKIRTTIAEPDVLAASLDPLRLTEVLAGSNSVPEGQQARFKMQLTNTATDGKTDPRVVNATAKVVAQIRTFLRRNGELKRPAPAFPKKLSVSMLPTIGQSTVIEVLFSTAGFQPDEYEVTFELQSPKGGKVSEASARFSIVENLQLGDLLGFDFVRTGQGRGADASVKKGSNEDLGGRSFFATHKHQDKGVPMVEHAYLRFDLKARAKLELEVDRVVLLLSLDTEGLRWKSTINAYGVPPDFAKSWSEKGDQHLTWETSPSAKQVDSLPFLGQVEFDNSGGAAEKQTDRIRIFSEALDDYVRQSKDTVTVLLVRTSSSDKETRFTSREGNSDRAPALAIRVKS